MNTKIIAEKLIKIAKNILSYEPLVKEIDNKLNGEILSKGGLLYHTTRKENAINILTHDYFRTSDGCARVKGLSTTFDPNYNWGTTEVKFVLNYNKLKSDYKLVFVDEQLNVNESEIKILSNTIIAPAKKYIVKIIYNGNDEEFKEMIKNFLE